MGRLIILPDKEEVPGSNPGAPTSDLQGFLPFATPPDPPSAILLQPKCSVVDGTGRGSLGVVVGWARWSLARMDVRFHRPTTLSGRASSWGRSARPGWRRSRER